MKNSKLILSILLCFSLLPPVKSSPLDAWTSVRTRNLFLISNAGADELRQVAAWLELFQDAFSKLLSRRVFESSVPTVGIVFRNDRDFQPFKPLYQGKPEELAGYFQPGDDVNYIAISLERGSRDSLNAAFHEYVHLYIRNNAPQTPLWLNEGLAEFYSTFELADGQAVVGAPITGYIRLLRNSDQLPLASLFSVDHASAHYHERDKRGIFYAESWALVHYLMLGNNGQRQAQLGRYLSLLGAGVSVENSFNMAFQISLADMERELNDYIHSDSFPTQRTNFGRRENYGAIETEALSQAEADYYLGDLLLHTGRQADAERYFVEALSLDANLIKAHEALGIVRVRQGRIAEGQRHLERAAAQSSNYLVHFFYAYVLSRQGMDSQGAVLHYSPETLSTIRKHLQTAIKLAPESAEAYHLLAFVNLVANEQLDQSIELIKRAMRLEPGRQDLKLVLAQIYLRQGETDSGRRILESLARQNDDKELRARAESLLARSEGGVPQVPRFSTAGPSKTVSVVQPGGAAPAAGMNIDTSGTIPDVSEVVANYVKALGGEEKLRKLTSRITLGTAQVPGEFRGAPFETYEKSPNKAMTMVNVERLGVMSQGFDGSVGWRKAQAGALHRLRGSELAEAQLDCDLYAPLRLNLNYIQVKVLGRVKIGYRQAYLLEAKPAVGQPDKFYFELESGNLIRWDGVRSDWRGRGPVEIYFDDWRDVEGVKVPFRVTRSSPYLTILFTVKEVKQNVPIEERIFTQPAPK